MARDLSACNAELYKIHYGDFIAELRGSYRLPDTTLNGCQDRFTIDGTDYSMQYLKMMMRVASFADHHDFRNTDTYMEIGGGYGATVHIVLTMFPNIRKVVLLDIPPILYVATQHLKSCFGDSAVIDYRTTRKMDALSFSKDDSIEILCVAPWQIEVFEKSDLEIGIFHNSTSFQEMPESIVRNYVNKMKPRLAPNAAICLHVNERPRQKEDHASHTAIYDAFSPQFVFQGIPARLDFPRQNSLVLGIAKN